ncbi:MAG: 23S rRNA (adenine(2503)-C(2))-methyltransferase RlmN [Spirochaetota bacterium]
MPSSHEVLFGKSLLELQELCLRLGWPKFRAQQIYTQIYRGGYAGACRDFSSLKGLSKNEQVYLQEHYDLMYYEPLNLQQAEDGTIKFVYPLKEYFLPNTGGLEQKPLAAVEAVLIPGTKEYTLCLSSQWGCRWACQFCQTGEMGLQRQLSSAEILAQFRCAQDILKTSASKTGLASVSRVVFMGMGEPLENPELGKVLEILSDPHGGYGLGARRITVSTVGLGEYLPAFFALEKPYRLALSVHNPISDERSRLIPAEFSSPLEDVIRQIERRRDCGDRRRLTFEYTLIDGENDQDYHAEALADLALRVQARINLIACHKNKAGYLGSSRLERFQELLQNRSIRCTVRKSRGEEIAAACGMLIMENSLQ